MFVCYTNTTIQFKSFFRKGRKHSKEFACEIGENGKQRRGVY